MIGQRAVLVHVCMMCMSIWCSNASTQGARHRWIYTWDVWLISGVVIHFMTPAAGLIHGGSSEKWMCLIVSKYKWSGSSSVPQFPQIGMSWGGAWRRCSPSIRKLTCFVPLLHGTSSELHFSIFFHIIYWLHPRYSFGECYLECT